MQESEIVSLIRQILTARSVPPLPEISDGNDIGSLFRDLAAIRDVLTQYSRGNFDNEISVRGYVASCLKALQANLRHLAWQVQQVAEGDFSQRVEFMGAFSEAFNSMVNQLDVSIRELKDRETNLLKLTSDLQMSEERWNLAVQCSRDGIWDANIDTKEAWYSDSFMQLLQYSHEELPKDLRWDLLIHPEDKEQAEILRQIVQGVTFAPFSTECRVKTHDNDYLWVRLRGMPVKTHSESTHRIIGVMSDITPQKEIEKALAFKATHDSLTGLPNRYLLNDRLRQYVAHSIRTGEPFILVTLDLDYFKQVNDTYGHAAGDVLLVEFSKRISAGLRNTDSVARFGGDEFTVVYACTKGMEQKTTEHVMERFYNSLSDPIDLGMDVLYNIRSSVGAAFFPEHAADIPTLFERADAALYESKRKGKNQYTIWDPTLEPAPKE